MASKKASKKELILIAKYTIKRNGATVYRVRSSEPNKKGRVDGTDQVERNGLWYDAHNVTVYKDETVCGCTCKRSEFKGKCYHRDGIQARLDAAKQVVVMTAQTVESTKVVELPKRDTSSLNGAQQSAGLLMELPSRKARAS